jgi:hypothetical protein
MTGVTQEIANKRQPKPREGGFNDAPPNMHYIDADRFSEWLNGAGQWTPLRMEFRQIRNDMGQLRDAMLFWAKNGTGVMTMRSRDNKRVICYCMAICEHTSKAKRNPNFKDLVTRTCELCGYSEEVDTGD